MPRGSPFRNKAATLLPPGSSAKPSSANSASSTSPTSMRRRAPSSAPRRRKAASAEESLAASPSAATNSSWTRGPASTRVAAVHTEVFGTIDDVARAKSELIESLPADCTAVLNAADPRVLAMASRAAGRVITCGEGGDVRAKQEDIDAQLPTLREHVRRLARACDPPGQ